MLSTGAGGGGGGATLSGVGQAGLSEESSLDFVRNQPAVTWGKGSPSRGNRGYRALRQH